MLIDFQYESGNDNPRMSFRVSYDGLVATLASHSATKTNVMNISSTGIALALFSLPNGKMIKNGDIIAINLLLEDNLLISNIKIKVVYVNAEKGFCGCEYVDSTRIQAKKLDVIILKLQKLEIQKKKIKAEKKQIQENTVKKTEKEVKDYNRTGFSIYEKGQDDEASKEDNVKISISKWK